MMMWRGLGGALRLSALVRLVWLVWYRMGVTRGGHVDGGVHTCRVRLRRNGRRRVVWMMMMWRPSIASLSLEINLSRFGFGNMNPSVLYRIQRWSLAPC